MPDFRLFAKRTLQSGPPNDLAFGELAYSDEEERLYIGRATEGEPPTSFEGNAPEIGPALATINGALAEVNTALSALDEVQTAQGTAIADIDQVNDSQGEALGVLTTAVEVINQGLQAIPAAFSTALSSKSNDADLAPVAKSGAYADLTGLPSLFSGAYADLTGLPSLFSGVYADLSGKPSLFSGVYADLSGKPSIPAGFTYDQSSEPTNPTAGQTWIERSVSGPILGRWEWDSDVLRWVSLDLFGSQFTFSSSGTSFPNVGMPGMNDPRGTYLYSGFRGTAWIDTTANATNYYDLRVQASIRDPGSSSITNGPAFITLLSNSPARVDQVNQTVVVNVTGKQLIQYNSGLIGWRFWQNATGSPGGLRTVLSILWRKVR